MCILCENPTLASREQHYVKKWYVHGHGVRHKAKEMGVPVAEAQEARRRYLVEQLYWWTYYIDETVLGIGNRFRIPDGDIQSIIRELTILNERTEAPPRTTITADMVYAAKQVPVGNLLDFKNGKIRCINPLHEDNNPTMFNGTRKNEAVCPACGKSYDTISILQITQGISFQEAVRRLC